MIELRLMGEPTLRGRRLPAGRLPALLRSLADDPERGRSVEALVADVFGDAVPERPEKALSVLVWRLRQGWGADVVRTTNTGYAWGLDPDAIDLVHARRRLSAARAALADGSHEAALAEAESAIEAGDPDTARAGRRLAVLAAQRAARPERALTLLADHQAEVGVDDTDEELVLAEVNALAATVGRSAALARYERCRRVLADTLGTDPGHALREMHAVLLADDTPTRTGLRADPTPLLGREDDLARVRHLLTTSRLVTILGPGGLGKTRLAHAVGREDGSARVHFVDLTGTRSNEVAPAVAAAFGLPDSCELTRDGDVVERLCRYIDTATTSTLLILDNCEHVIDAVAALVDVLLARSAGVTVLTTSRRRLHLGSETVLPLTQLSDDTAAELFAARARAARPDVVLDEEAVGRIVARLDGLPLALELAAAKVRTMSVADLATRLGSALKFLRGADGTAPDRHRTLEGVIEWSWRLLDEPARDALTRLAVLPDGWAPAVAERIVGPDAVEVLESLVDSSMVQLSELPSVRHRMLATVREFALARLGGELARAEADIAALAAVAAHVEPAIPRTHETDEVACYALLRAEATTLSVLTEWAVRYEEPDHAVVIFHALLQVATAIATDDRMLVHITQLTRLLLRSEIAPEHTEHLRNCLAMGVVVHSFGEASHQEGLPPRAESMRLAGGVRHRLRHLPPVPRPVEFEPWGEFALRFTEFARRGSDPFMERHLHGDEPALVFAAVMIQGHVLENRGETRAALELALDGRTRLMTMFLRPSQRAMLDLLIAMLHSRLGEMQLAEVAVARAMPALEAIHAQGALTQARTYRVRAALDRGETAMAEQLLAGSESEGEPESVAGLRWITDATRAEVLAARGRTEEALTLYREVSRQSLTHPPDGSQLAVLSAAVCAHALHDRLGGVEDLVVGLEDAATRAARTWFDVPLQAAGLLARGLVDLREAPLGGDLRWRGLQRVTIARRVGAHELLGGVRRSGLLDERLRGEVGWDRAEAWLADLPDDAIESEVRRLAGASDSTGAA